MSGLALTKTFQSPCYETSIKRNWTQINTVFFLRPTHVRTHVYNLLLACFLQLNSSNVGRITSLGDKTRIGREARVRERAPSRSNARVHVHLSRAPHEADPTTHDRAETTPPLDSSGPNISCEETADWVRSFSSRFLRSRPRRQCASDRRL